MADDKKKPSLAVLIGMGKPKAGADEAPDSEEMGEDEGSSLDAAHALLDAIKAGDAEGVDAALKAHMDLCSDESEA